jgi:hypothetical protein
VRLNPVGEDFESLPAAEISGGFAPHEVQQPLHPPVTEVLGVRGIRIQGVLDPVVEHRRADADTWIEAAAGQDINGGQVLGEPQRVFPAQRGNRGAEFDAPGALRGSRQHGHGRGDAVLQMAVADPGAVEAQALAQFDQLERGLMALALARVGLVEEPDGQEPQLAQRS